MKPKNSVQNRMRQAKNGELGSVVAIGSHPTCLPDVSRVSDKDEPLIHPQIDRAHRDGVEGRGDGGISDERRSFDDDMLDSGSTAKATRNIGN